MHAPRRLVLTTVAILGLSLVGSGAAPAPKEAPVTFDASKTIAANLAAFTGRVVTVQLHSGKSVEGTVEGVNDGQLHLGRLAGKEFYDALVAVASIEAVEIRVGPRP